MKKTKRTKSGGTWRPGKPGRPPNKMRRRRKDDVINADAQKAVQDVAHAIQEAVVGPRPGAVFESSFGATSYGNPGIFERVLYLKHLGEVLNGAPQDSAESEVLLAVYDQELKVLSAMFEPFIAHLKAIEAAKLEAAKSAARAGQETLALLGPAVTPESAPQA